MFARKVSLSYLVPILIHIVVLAKAEVIDSRETIYSLFKVSMFFWPPKNLANNFERKNYAHIQIDVFIGSEAADSRLVNLVVKYCSRKNALIVSSLSKARPHVASIRNASATSSKLENLILVYDAASRIDLVALKISFGHRWNPRARIIACVEKVDNKTSTEILEYFWEHDLLNVALTVQSETSAAGFVENFIYNPFVPGKLPTSRGMLKKLKSGDSMFPDKLTNLHNHTIPISVFFHFPKARLMNFTRLKEGADIEVLWALSKKLNFRIDLKTASVYAPSYTVRLPSDEVVGIIGDVLVNRSDMVFNAQYIESTIGRRVEFTYPILQTGYCILVPKAKLMPMIVRMLKPFPVEIWIANLGVVGFVLICLTLMSEKNKFMKISELLLRYSFGNIQKHIFNRIFCISCIFWAFLISCIYQANFIHELILPKYYKDIDTLEELYDSNLPLLIGEKMMGILNNSEVPVFKKLAKRAVKHLVLNDCTRQLLTSFNVSCGVDEYVSVLLARFHTKNNSTFLIHSVKECLSLHWDVYVVRNGFPFLEKFNQLVQSLLEAGLYNKWLTDLLKVNSTTNEESKTGILTMKHWEGIFGLWFLGFGISVAAFILELSVFRLSVKIDNVFSFLS